MEFDLVVMSPVAGKEKGERITDATLIEAIMSDERRAHVQRVAKAPAAESAAPVEEPAATAD